MSLERTCIGLFGTCGSSKWRDSFIKTYNNLEISYFNPQVANWDPSLAVIEAEHLINDEIILFPVTSETYGTGSLSETGFSILSAIRSNEQRYFVIFIDPTVDEALKTVNPTAAKESIRARALVRAHLNKQQHPSVFIVNTLDEMFVASVELHEVLRQIKLLRHNLSAGTTKRYP